jgi:hypothetical protein
MYLSVGVVAVLILVLVSPALWVAWWSLAELGERTAGSHARVRLAAGVWSTRRAA